MTAEDGSQDMPDEHVRFAAHLQALSQVPDDAELALVAKVLTDPDVAMGQSAVCRHLDRRAGTLVPGPDYVPWAQAMADVVASHPFLVQRLHEWSLFRALTLRQSWSPDALTGASSWLQLKIATRPGTTEAAVILAEAGRTKRIRNAARAQLRTPPTRPRLVSSDTVSSAAAPGAPVSSPRPSMFCRSAKPKQDEKGSLYIAKLGLNVRFCRGSSAADAARDLGHARVVSQQQ